MTRSDILAIFRDLLTIAVLLGGAWSFTTAFGAMG